MWKQMVNPPLPTSIPWLVKEKRDLHLFFPAVGNSGLTFFFKLEILVIYSKQAGKLQWERYVVYNFFIIRTGLLLFRMFFCTVALYIIAPLSSPSPPGSSS